MGEAPWLGSAIDRIDAQLRLQLWADQQFEWITFSRGVVDIFVYPDPHTVSRAVDDALYLAKEGGRNQLLSVRETSKFDLGHYP